MTDNDITRLIAERVMGRELEECGRVEDVKDGVVIESRALYCVKGKPYAFFAPTTDDSDAFRVVDKMVEDGFTFHFNQWPDGCAAGFYKTVGHPDCSPLIPSRCRAICLAALRAVGVEVE